MILNNTSFLFILTNCVAAVNFLLVIYSSILTEKHDYIVIRLLSMTLNLIVYALGFCWSSVIINVFTIFRDMYNDRVKKPKIAVIALFCILGTVMTFVVNYFLAENFSSTSLFTLKCTDYIPAISLIVYTICIFKAKTAAQMKIATAIDILFWVIYDFENFMIVNVIQDLFLIFLPVIEFYVEAIKKRNQVAFA